MTMNNDLTQESLEYTIIGTLLAYPQAAGKIINNIGPYDFALLPARQAFEAMQQLTDTGKPIDLTLVANELASRNSLEDVGGESGLAQLLDYAVDGQLMDAYVDKLLHNAGKRHMKHLVKHAYQKLEKGSDISEVRASLLADLNSLVIADGMKAPSSIDDILDCLNAASEQHMIRTGYQKLDALHGGGLTRGGMTVIGAAPSIGKTQFVINLITRMMSDGYAARTLCLSMEMSSPEMLNRLIAVYGNMNQATVKATMQGIEGTSLPSVTLDSTEKVMMQVRDLPVKFLSGSFTADNLQSIAASTSGQYDVIVVDYLQRCAGTKQQKTLERVEAASRACKDIALRHNVAVIAVASLNRDGYRERDIRPDLSHLRECGNIEYDADNVWMLWREKNEGVHEETLELHIRKQRNGPLDWLRYNINLPTGRVTEE